MLDKEKTFEPLILSKRLDVRIGIAVGNLETHSEKERKDEEICHLLILEKTESLQAKNLCKR